MLKTERQYHFVVATKTYRKTSRKHVNNPRKNHVVRENLREKVENRRVKQREKRKTTSAVRFIKQKLQTKNRVNLPKDVRAVFFSSRDCSAGRSIKMQNESRQTVTTERQKRPL